jgi:hypothetical protein
MFGTDRGATSAVGFYPTSYSEPNRINNNRRFAPVRSVERGRREGAWQRRGNATLRHICAEVRSLGKSHSSENGRRKFDRAIPRTPRNGRPPRRGFLTQPIFQTRLAPSLSAADFATAIGALPLAAGSSQLRRGIWRNCCRCRCPSASSRVRGVLIKPSEPF